MSETSSPNDLTSRLETDRQQIEETATRELKQLSESFGAVRSDALRSIEADTEAATVRMRAMLLKAWLRPLVVGMSFFIGICGGSWATMHWLSRSIQDRIETLGRWTCGPSGRARCWPRSKRRPGAWSCWRAAGIGTCRCPPARPLVRPSP